MNEVETTIKLKDPYLRDRMAAMGFVLTRGRGAGKVGSIQQFLDYLAAGEVIAFPAAGLEYGHLFEAATTLERLAEEMHPQDPARLLLAALVAATRAAATRQADLDRPEPDDEEDTMKPREEEATHDPFKRDDDGRIIAVRLVDDDGRPYTLADAKAADPEEFKRFIELFGDNPPRQ